MSKVPNSKSSKSSKSPKSSKSKVGFFGDYSATSFATAESTFAGTPGIDREGLTGLFDDCLDYAAGYSAITTSSSC